MADQINHAHTFSFKTNDLNLLVTTERWCAYHGNKSPNELEVLKVIRVDVRGRVDLKTVVVLASILKQTVHWIQHLMRQQEEPFPENKHKWSNWLSVVVLFKLDFNDKISFYCLCCYFSNRVVQLLL